MTCHRTSLCILSTLLLLCPLSLSHAIGRVAGPLGTVDYSGSGAALQVLRGTPEYTSITLSSSNVTIESKTLGYDTYRSFGIPGEPFIMEEGVPEVPLIARFYRIPNLGGVDLVLSNTEDFELIEGVNVMPYQVEGSDHFGMARSAVMDQDAWYPPNIAEMSEPMILRDFRVVRVALYPVQVNPARHQARIYHNLQAEVVANDQPGINEITNPGPPSGSWVAIYRDLLPNLPDAELADATVIPGKMMIMCKNNSLAKEWADSLRIWKKRKGFDVFIDSTHTTSAAQMISYIQQVYATPGPKLEYVVLIGDPDWTYGVPSDGSNYDHSFGLGNAGDDLVDIAVGRLSGDASQLGTINAKIMGYERTPYMQNGQGQADTTWYHKGFFYAGVAFQVASNYTLMQWGAQEFRNFTGVDSNFTDYFDAHWELSEACNQLDQGVSFFLIRPAWQYEVDPLSSCVATWRQPVSFLITCNANDFVGGTGMAEQWAREGTATNPKGVVVCAGTASALTHAPQNITLTGGMLYGMADLQLEHYGDCAVEAELWLTKLWGPGSWQANDFSRYFNVMGDPSLSMWTDVPNVVDVEHPTTVNVGSRDMEITVTDLDNGTPIADALVCLWKGTETWMRGVTDASGYVELPITINSAGSLLLTVTKRNHKPYLYTINCVQAAQMVTVSSFTVDDDNSGGSQGNGDHLFEPGERIDLPVYLRNFGNSATATNVSATLASDNPNVAVVNGSSTFANIAPGDSALSATAFRIDVSPVMAHTETALLTFTITASSVQTFSSLSFTNHAGQADYVSHLFTGTVNPGTTNNLRVTLYNSGEITLPGATAQLISLSPFVQVDDAGGTFGDIPAGQNITNSVDQFTLTSVPSTFRGHQAPMRLILSTSNGFVDTTQFSVSIGTATSTDPTGPDAYGYYAYDNSDVSYQMHPTFNYVNISSGLGEDLNINDPGVKDVPTPVYSVARPLPFPFTFYGQSYDEITICANGWVAFGNQVQLDLFRNYPLPAMEAPGAMIAPYWDDLRTDGSQGVWKYDDTANHRCIIQWKAAVYTGGTLLDFEVILLDTAFYPTQDGNGQILVQYNDAAMGVPGDADEPNGCAIGIQQPQGLVGLQYAWLTSYMPGSATVSDGRAILFTTAAVALPSPLSLMTPNGGEAWFRDSTVTVAWFGGTPGSNVSMELSRTGVNGPWTFLTASTPNDGAYPWVVTGSNSQTCRVRIAEVGNPSQADTSASDFTIGGIQIVFSEDFEDQAPNWTHTNSGAPWVDNWNPSTERAYDGISSYKCGDTGTGYYLDLCDAFLVSPIVTNLPADATLTFEHQIISEVSGTYPDSCYDGGLLEISADGGAFTQMFPLSGYDKHFRYRTSGGRPYSGPLPGLECWANGDTTITTWRSASVDLSAYASQDVQLRWRFCSDSSGTREGWYVDAVSVYAPNVISEPVVPVNVTLYQYNGNLVLRWAPDSNTHYRIYSGATPDNPMETLVGSTTTTQFTIPGGAAATRRFYVVVGWDGN